MEQSAEAVAASRPEEREVNKNTIHSSPHGPQFVFALGAFVDHFWVMVVGRFIFGYVDNMRDSFNATPSHISLTLHAPFTHVLTHTSHRLTFASFPTLTKLVCILGLVDG